MKKRPFILFLYFISASIAAQERMKEELSIPLADELSYGSPSDVHLDSTFIHTQVDSIITNGIKQQAFPGAQVLVAKEGRIIFHKAYGFHTYDSLQPVALDDLYDLASVTKIAAALPALMKLVDEGKLDLDQPFSTYWTRWKGKKDKENLSLREILAHQAGLVPYIVFLNKIFKKNGRPKKRFVRPYRTRKFSQQAYQGIFINRRFKKKMYRIIDRSEVSDKKKYTYSGLTFLLYPALIEQLAGIDYETYLNTHFYGPLGMETTGFQPKTKQYPNKIVPTEKDTLFRHGLTQGWVHDENASLLGGVSGNAGLFATAVDLAKLMQLYMQLGTYAGKRYFSEATVKEFIKGQYPENDNRRGLGFDKPYPNNSGLPLSEAYPAPEVAPESFGHSGFTGTFVWADPENQLVYIFLSNRVYPSRKHRNLYSLHIREAVQQVFYRAQLPTE
ncbi:serine hydrolase [Flavobacteriaceae bacterium TP-CH-4]|uniref:Serine hydrolase n=1 Tax=Pelagihabitans pacificus TaxID=2696054 RepID=A0A967E6B8_9FLAO|nr:serine hydrolase [Pelagihabitans pacificus]NHF60347.1 serine hydrolase [Pelagihabitans pacificus]